MDPRPKPGRDDRGRFLTNDATSGQVIELLADALDAALDGREHTAWALIKAARETAKLTDAGERPATEEP